MILSTPTPVVPPSWRQPNLSPQNRPQAWPTKIIFRCLMTLVKEHSSRAMPSGCYCYWLSVSPPGGSHAFSLIITFYRRVLHLDMHEYKPLNSYTRGYVWWRMKKWLNKYDWVNGKADYFLDYIPTNFKQSIGKRRKKRPEIMDPFFWSVLIWVFFLPRHG